MALEQIKQVSGTGAYVAGDDIDTDQIIPARFLLCVTFDALGGQLFYDARFERDGTPKQHALNDARFVGAKVLLSGSNFGCGSSREHAPQSIHKAGFRAVVAESFAEIFFGNSTTLGIPCVSLKRAEIAELAAAIERDPKLEISVDLEKLEVRAGGKSYPCSIKQSARDALVRGEWDPIAQLIEGQQAAETVGHKLPYTSW
ncbi:MAG: 3-isopropylmalate dehydratase small subunit [Myxococcales bacterium]